MADAAGGAAGDLPGRAVAASFAALRRLTDAVDRRAWWCTALGLVVLALIAWYVTWHVPHSGWLFTSHYDAGFKDLHFRLVDVNDARGGRVLYPPDIASLEYFVYPPAALWLFWPLTWVGTFTGELLWSFATLVFLAWMIASAARFACRWSWRKAWAVSLLVATPLSTLILQPVGVHLALGQVGLFLAAPATFDILCVRRRSARGFLTGVTAALKIYPLVYLVLFALKREWRALGNAVAGVLVTTGVAWVVFPGYTATFFLHRLIGGNELRHYWNNKHWLSSSSSVYTLFFRQPFTGSSLEHAVAFLACVAVVGLGVYAAWVQLREGRELSALLCLALASTIGSPVAWDHYFIWVVFVPFVLVEQGPLPWWRVTSLTLFGLTCLIPLRLARNEDLSHKAYDWVFLVIFTARNALTAVSLLWLVVAAIPWRPGDRAQAVDESAERRSATHALSSG